MKHLAWLLFLPGFLGYSAPLTIDPGSLFTWNGSCVLIPCMIGTYKGAYLTATTLIWYFQPFYDTNSSDFSGHILYNSSSTSRTYRTRFRSPSGSQLEFVGNLAKKNCSLKISKARTEDSGMYGARLLASFSTPANKGKWFLNATVNVAESPPVPKMDISPKDLQEGRMTVTCSVPYHCPEEPLRLIISGLEKIRLSSQKTTHSNGVIQTLVSFQVTWEDHGKSLDCSLKRQKGPEISKSTIQLDVKYAPKDVQVIASPGTIIREGEALSLECTIKSSNPEVDEYLWYKDNRQMYERSKIIEFETVEDQHSGAYRCEAKNSVRSVMSKGLHIDAQYPPKEVKIERKPPGMIKEGEKIELKCSSKANPQISHYEWYKLPQIYVFQNGDRLQFNAIQLEDAGTYYCTANNSLGQSGSSPITLDILYGPKDVRLITENDQLPIKEKDPVRLNCSFSHSNPSDSISYKWYKGKSRVTHQGNLWIFPAELDKAGDYTCEVCNSVKCVQAQPVTVDIHSHPQTASLSSTAGPRPTAESEGPQSSPLRPSTLEGVSSSYPSTSSPALPSTPEGVSSPLPSTSSPLPSTPKGVPSPLPSTSSPSSLPSSPVSIPPLSSSQTSCDGRALLEEFCFFSELLEQVMKAQNQFSHSFQELTSVMVKLTEKFQEALIQKRQKACMVHSEMKNP